MVIIKIKILFVDTVVLIFFAAVLCENKLSKNKVKEVYKKTYFG